MIIIEQKEPALATKSNSDCPSLVTPWPANEDTGTEPNLPLLYSYPSSTCSFPYVDVFPGINTNQYSTADSYHPSNTFPVINGIHSSSSSEISSPTIYQSSQQQYNVLPVNYQAISHKLYQPWLNTSSSMASNNLLTGVYPNQHDANIESFHSIYGPSTTYKLNSMVNFEVPSPIKHQPLQQQYNALPTYDQVASLESYQPLFHTSFNNTSAIPDSHLTPGINFNQYAMNVNLLRTSCPASNRRNHGAGSIAGILDESYKSNIVPTRIATNKLHQGQSPKWYFTADGRLRVECTFCRKYFFEKSLKKHQETHQPIQETFKCPHCPKKYDYKRSLTRHFKNKHY